MKPVTKAEGYIKARRLHEDKNEEQEKNHFPVVEIILPTPFQVTEAALDPNSPYQGKVE